MGRLSKRRRVARAAATRPAGPSPAARQRKIGKLQITLKTLKAALKQYDQAVVAAERKLLDARATRQEKSVAEAVAEARASRDSYAEAIADCRSRLAAMKDSPKAVPTTGRVERYRPAPAEKNVGGVVKRIEHATVPDHRMQIWKLPRGSGRRTYRIAMAHAEAGPFGAFNYVAYCDADADGSPDRLIARSPLAEAETSGGWTSWTFSTSEADVFVGNSWPRADTVLYCAKAAEQTGNWRMLPREMYISGSFGPVQIGTHRFRPYVTNLRVSTVNPHDVPDRPSRSIGSRYIIQQRR